MSRKNLDLSRLVVVLILSLGVSLKVYSQEKKQSEATFANQWYHQLMGTAKAWRVTQGNLMVPVLICDSGIDSQHPDLVGNIGIGHNGTGLFGIAPQVQIIPGVIIGKIVNTKQGPVGVATVETMSACIQYAIDHHIRIVNMSYFALSAPEVLEKARLLHQAGGMLFLPSGNSGEEMTYPKSDDYVVVSSTEPSDWFC